MTCIGASEFIQKLRASICEGIRRYGIRNSQLTAIAPAGSISLLANNVSSGLEPVFASRYRRRFRRPGGAIKPIKMIDYAYRVFHDWNFGDPELPPGYATATEVPPESHLAMQAVLQRHVDNSIAKTVYLPDTIDFDDFSRLYEKAYALGIKGFTMFRPNPITGQVLVNEPAQNNDDHCCVLDRQSCSVSLGAE